MYQVRPTLTFERDFKKLSPDIRRLVAEKIDWLAQLAMPPGQPLQHLPPSLSGLRKYRVGDWRILFWVINAPPKIVLYGVEHRGAVYRRLR
ncbi:MAG: type II toxin-antitoxin system RelE/ParE family toxin [Candidatus Magasanikbacteria bacterium]|nr:type II toxin-antitoxin system RelE/ParE family toxin [Candidatus Magasanikbacteria bacterium]